MGVGSRRDARGVRRGADLRSPPQPRGHGRAGDFRGFPWRKVAPYALAQTLGAFLAAAIVRFVYADLIALVDPQHTIKTQGIFSTLPGNGLDGVSVTTAFFDQIVGTAILVFVIFALTTARNAPPLANFAPVVIGLLVVAIGMAWGANAATPSTGPRLRAPLLSLITGYESAMFDQHGTLYFWLPIVAPIIGGLIGGLMFTQLIERFLPADEPVLAEKE